MTPRTPGFVALAVAAALGATVATAGCRPTSPPTTSLRVDGAPDDALVSIDDQVLGTLGYVRSRGVALPPGPHRLSVEHPGYFPVDRIIEARPGEARIELDVRLEPIPD